MSDPAVRGSLDVLQALIWVSMRRVKPELTFSDLEDLAIDEIEWVEDEPDPREPAEEAGEPSSS